jgi:hypothetical protein
MTDVWAMDERYNEHINKIEAEFSTDFAMAQSEMDHASKDSKNPHLKNRYASLSSVIDAVKPALNRHGITFSQEVEGWDYKAIGEQVVHVVCVETRVRHKSGYSTSFATTVPVKAKASVPDAQEVGSAVTYARRYALQSLFGIGAEDDDGNEASNTVSLQSQRKDNVSDESQNTLTQEQETYRTYLNAVGKAASMEALLLINEKLSKSVLSQEYKDKVLLALDTKRKSL